MHFRSIAECHLRIWKFCRTRGCREGIEFLGLEITNYVMRGENRKLFSGDHEMMEFSVSCRSLCAL